MRVDLVAIDLMRIDLMRIYLMRIDLVRGSRLKRVSVKGYCHSVVTPVCIILCYYGLMEFGTTMFITYLNLFLIETLEAGHNIEPLISSGIDLLSDLLPTSSSGDELR